MRYVAPTRHSLDRSVFASPPLSAWGDYTSLLDGDTWPDTALLNALLPPGSAVRFAMQDKALLDDGLHYEERIARKGAIATRAENWHDLFNALIWLRYPSLKRALNARQMDEIARMGPRERSRPQCALTHFDEAGMIVSLRDPAMLHAWDAHDWSTLFWTHREAWLRGEASVEVFGHALLEHALTPEKLLVGKALVVMDGRDARAVCAAAIHSGAVLNDPQELRPLPVSGVPGWHADTEETSFYTTAPCFQPLRAGRVYPPPL
ncbi:MAG: DUF3025 domain-containing protein [Luteibacter sp.]|uniref:DUF3025 domain-containing protein n=1 Tax=Luteibacter sp. TaxID=1886636 RepID=UPI0028075266|nr:DUF3025 domain-containing protein [Luteibacter sp.]MDQ7995502.1 DUF3025 domain-containing protein [Luteibacter sp.]MDQ8048889.1 DUF3025 domain-containing protein [Luteibacter sp.]